jgi:hypothetical protein
MEDQIDTLDVHDRREMRAIWGAESTLSDSRNLWDSRSLKSNDFPVAQFRD